jgi:hypothetical protein
MHEQDEYDWNNEEDEDDESFDSQSEDERRQSLHDKQHKAIQKMFADMEKRAKKSIQYLIMEGFVVPTEIPGVYEYTPEGLVLAQQKYKKLLEDDDI